MGIEESKRGEKGMGVERWIEGDGGRGGQGGREDLDGERWKERCREGERERRRESAGERGR